LTPSTGLSEAKQASPPTRGRTVLSGRQEHTSTQSQGLTNARTRIVGQREGFLADVIVTLVRFSRTASARIGTFAGRLAAVVTPLGWSILIIVPVSLAAGYRFGWTELVAIGYAGAVMVAVAAVYLIGRSPFILELTLPHRRVVIGDNAGGVVSVRNPTRRRILGV